MKAGRPCTDEVRDGGGVARGKYAGKGTGGARSQLPPGAVREVAEE